MRYIGLSEVSPSDVRKAHAIHPVTALEMEWSLFTRDAEVTRSPPGNDSCHSGRESWCPCALPAWQRLPLLHSNASCARKCALRGSLADAVAGWHCRVPPCLPVSTLPVWTLHMVREQLGMLVQMAFM